MQPVSIHLKLSLVSALLSFGYLALFPACAPRILFSVSHQGWIRAMALGGRTPVSQAVGLATTSASVTLGWNPMSPATTTYNVYRGTSAGEENYSSPLTTGLTSTYFTDNSVSPLSNYYYVVKPVVGRTEYTTTDPDTEIKIMVPPINMLSVTHKFS